MGIQIHEESHNNAYLEYNEHHSPCNTQTSTDGGFFFAQNKVKWSHTKSENSRIIELLATEL